MRAEKLIKIIGGDLYTGVPDSLLKPLCDCLYNLYGVRGKHIVAANEGNAAAIAAGYYLATGKVPAVYMQNSGEGNIVNPSASLLCEKVYAIPVLYIIGWRGEPGVHDEPQHIYQGEITLELLDLMGIKSFVIDKDTADEQVKAAMRDFRKIFARGGQAAFVIKKGALTNDEKAVYGNDNIMKREEIISLIARAAGDDPIISTTGKASRELYEFRESEGSSHKYDFLTVGSMGHTSSIALGAALARPDIRFWCIDGDGSAIMHMGAMAVIGAQRPENLIHIVINNGSHETVGGMPTAAGGIDWVGLAVSLGYPYAVSVSSREELISELENAASAGKLCFIEVKSAIGARADLSRPATSPCQNKQAFMEYLNELRQQK